MEKLELIKEFLYFSKLCNSLIRRLEVYLISRYPVVDRLHRHLKPAILVVVSQPNVVIASTLVLGQTRFQALFHRADAAANVRYLLVTHLLTGNLACLRCLLSAVGLYDVFAIQVKQAGVLAILQEFKLQVVEAEGVIS